MNKAVVSAAIACVAGSVAVVAICVCCRRRTQNDVKNPPENLPNDPSEESERSQTKVDTMKGQEIYFGDGGKQQEKGDPKSGDADSDDSARPVPASLSQSHGPPPSGSSIPAPVVPCSKLIDTLGPPSMPAKLD